MAKPTYKPTNKSAMLIWDDTNKVWKAWDKTVIFSGGLISGEYDYVVVTYPTTTTETYVFKDGGSGGTTVATVNIVYLAADKKQLSTVTKT